MPGPDRQFWQTRFDLGDLPWDRGAPHPQLREWLDSGALRAGDHDGPVAVPGCGTGHEVHLLAERGFEVIAIDYTPAACAATSARLDGPLAARVQVVLADVLAWTPAAPLAAVYEQTCLCALHPDHWIAYARALHAWLRPGGRLWLLAMQALRPSAATGMVEGPPYHVDINALRALFPHPDWAWPAPPYPLVPHPRFGGELALVLERR